MGTSFFIAVNYFPTYASNGFLRFHRRRGKLLKGGKLREGGKVWPTLKFQAAGAEIL